MKKILTLLCLFYLGLTGSIAQDCTIGTTVGSTCTLTVDGILTIPAGANLMIEVKAWGAGGGSESAKNKRSGGGGGAYFNSTYSVTGGSTYAIVVGQGAMASAGGYTSFDFVGGGPVIVGGGGLGMGLPGLGGTGPGAISGGDGGNRETGGLNAGGGGGGSGPGNGSGGIGGNPVNGIGGLEGTAGSSGAAGGTGGNDQSMGATPGANGAFPGGGAGGKGTTATIEDGAAGGNGQVIVCVTEVLPLPVELVSFNAHKEKNHIVLNWKTASEVNTTGFEIQKSRDGNVWQAFEFLEGKGSALVSSSYEYIDHSPIQGINYYRLKQLDANGKFDYSEVLSIIFDQQNEIITFPNPVDDQLIIKTNEPAEAFIQILNTIGQVEYQTTQFVNTQLVIDVSKIQIGNYYLKITNARTGAVMHQQPIAKN